MITLQEITQKEKLEDYYRFRHQVYSQCKQSGFLRNSQGLDKDEFDAHSIHLGWYDQNELVGCVRLVLPHPESGSLHCFSHLNGTSLAILKAFTNTILKDNKRTVEVSRLCIAKPRRNLKSVKEFVLACMSISHLIGINNGLFTCNKQHFPFWNKMGFEPIVGTYESPSTKASETVCALSYNYDQLPQKMKSKLAIYNIAHAFFQSKAA